MMSTTPVPGRARAARSTSTLPAVSISGNNSRLRSKDSDVLPKIFTKLIINGHY